MKNSQIHNQVQPETRAGNALLIAILLTSILILITLGLARLITSESRQIADLIRNGHAEYLAEGGSELGQLIFYSTESSYAGDDYKVEWEINSQPAKIEFAVNTTTNHFPILPKEYFEGNIDDQRKQLLFQKLLPGESVEIPLTGNESFEVEYFLPNLEDTTLGDFTQADLNILLFKLSGEQENSASGDTSDMELRIDFLTDYLPAGGPDGSTGNIGKRANNPARIYIADSTEIGFNGGDFFEYSDGEDNPDRFNFDDSGEIIYNNGEDYSTPRKTIEEFLDSHENNILSLTNAINLDQINIPTSFADPTKLEEILGSIYYRICSSNCTAAETSIKNEQDPIANLIAPYVTINSTASYQSAQKNLLTQISRPNALSVFDFAIYRTVSTNSGTD